MGKLIEVNSTIQRIPESGHQVQLRAERKAIEQSGARRRAFTMLLLLLSLLLSLLLPLLFTFLSEAAIDTSALERIALVAMIFPLWAAQWRAVNPPLIAFAAAPMSTRGSEHNSATAPS